MNTTIPLNKHLLTVKILPNVCSLCVWIFLTSHLCYTHHDTSLLKFQNTFPKKKKHFFYTATSPLPYLGKININSIYLVIFGFSQLALSFYLEFIQTLCVTFDHYSSLISIHLDSPSTYFCSPLYWILCRVQTYCPAVNSTLYLSNFPWH